MSELTLDNTMHTVLQPYADTGRYNPINLTSLWLATLNVNTRKSYERSLVSWLSYCHGSGIDPMAARRADVDDWLVSLGDLSPATTNAKQAGVRSWYRYLSDNGTTEADPVGTRGRKKVDRDVTNTPSLSADEMAALVDRVAELADTRGTEPTVRNAAMVMLMLDTGVRSAAVLSSTMDQLKTVRGHRVLEYRNKGGRLLHTAISPPVAVMIDRYHALRADRHGCAVDELDGPMFTSAPYRGKGGDKPLTSADLREVIRRYATGVVAGADRLVPHSTRHAFITAALEEGCSITEVQDQVGHADPRTTQRYNHGRRRLDNSPVYRLSATLAGKRRYRPVEERLADVDAEQIPGQIGIPLRHES